jgi:hypothetical protein
VSVRQLAALAWRHVFAVGLILLATVGLALGFSHTQSGFRETATVALEPQAFASVEPVNINENFLVNSSLITTCQIIVMSLSGPQGAVALHQAGVSADFAVSVVNSSNSDTPNYLSPELSLSIIDGSSASAHGQFVEAMRVLDVAIAHLEADEQISTRDRFETFVLSDSGPISQRGSFIRTYASLALLALISMYLICRLLDRRPVRRVGMPQGGGTAALHRLRCPPGAP